MPKTSLKGVYKFWKLMREAVKDKDIKIKLDEQEIRLYDKNGHEFCPLTYCRFKNNGYKSNTGWWSTAAKEMGMNINYASNIVGAADANYDDRYGNKEKRIRRKLLKTLKLKEKTNGRTGN